MTLEPSFNTIFCRPDFFNRWFYCWKLCSSHLTSFLDFVHENIYYVPSVLLIDPDHSRRKECWDDSPCMYEAWSTGQPLVNNKPRLLAWPDRLSLSPHGARSAWLPLQLSWSLCPQGFSSQNLSSISFLRLLHWNSHLSMLKPHSSYTCYPPAICLLTYFQANLL